MDMWDGSEDCPWHWDGTDDSDMILLCYINKYREWDRDWGGQLRVGERDLKSRGAFIDFQEIKHVIEIQPQRRTIALVNNRNPRLVHKPETLNGYYERKVFTAGLKLTPKKKLNAKPKITC
jgi:hypothetical protein